MPDWAPMSMKMGPGTKASSKTSIACRRDCIDMRKDHFHIKIVIHLTSGGQPVTGTVERYNPYEILLQTAKGKLLVFKHAIATIEAVDEPKGYKL